MIYEFKNKSWQCYRSFSQVMLMHHDGDTLDYENDEDDHIVMKMMIRSVLINKKRAL